MVIIIYYLIAFFQDENADLYYGIVLSGAFILVSILSKFIYMNALLEVSYIVGKMKRLITTLITQKILRLHTSAMAKTDIKGKIINIVTTDMESLENLNYASVCLSYPFIFVGALLIAFVFFGPFGALGVASSLLYVPLTLWLGKISYESKMASSIIGDTKIKMVENLIEGIKLIKLYA